MSFMPGGAPGISNAMVRVGADFRGMNAATAKAMAQFRGQMAAGTQGLGTAATRANRFGNEMDAATRKASRLGMAVRGLSIGIGALGIGLGVMAIKAAIDFESAFAGVRKTVDASEQELERLRQAFLDLSGEIPVAASALARVGEAAGALGVPTDQIMEFTKVVSMIGTTTDVSVEEAGTALGQLSNILNLTGEDYSRFASTLVDLGNKGASTESQIVEITRRMGAAAKLFGIQTDQILALGSAAANLGMQPQLAASSLQRLIMRLLSISSGMDTIREIMGDTGLSIEGITRKVEAGGDTLEEFARQTAYSGKELTKIVAGAESLDALRMALGVTNAEFDRMRKNDPERIIEGMFRGMQKMDAAGRQLFITRLLGPAASAGGGVGMQQLMLGLADSVDRNLTPALRNATAAWEVNNAAAAEAEKRYATTSSQLQQLQNDFTRILIDAGTGSLPMVAEVLGKIREALPNIVSAFSGIWDTVQRPLQQVGDALFRLFNVMGDILFDWGGGGRSDGMLGTLNVMAEVTGTIANWLAAILDTTTALLSTPVVGALAKVAVLWGGIAVAFKGLSALRNFGAGMAMSMGSMLGRPIQSLTRSLSPGDKVQMDAALIQQKAATMQMAAATKAGVAGGAAMVGGRPVVYPNAPIGRPWGAGSADALGIQRAGAMAAQGQMTAFGAGMLSTVRSGAATALRAGTSLVSTGFGLVSRFFWPAFIADLVGNIIAAPIGDFIRQSTGMKRLADAWGRGWIEGMAGLVETVMTGSDVFVGRPGEYTFGSEATGQVTLPTDVIKQIVPEADREAFGKLLNAVETAETPLAQLGALGEVAEKIAQHQTEYDALAAGILAQREDYMRYLRGDATVPGLGMDEATWAAIQEQYRNTPFSADQQAAAAEAFPLPPDLDKVLSTSTEALQDAVVTAFREAGLTGMPLGRIGQMSPSSVSELVEAIQAVPANAPAGFTAYAARQLAGYSGITTGGADPMAQLRDNATEALAELKSVEAAIDTIPESYRRAFAQLEGGMFERIESATTKRQKIDIIKQMLPDKQDVRGNLDRYWSEVLEFRDFGRAQLGLNDKQRIADSMRQSLGEALSMVFTSGDTATGIKSVLAGMGDLLEDGIGGADTSDRISSGILTALQAGVEKAGKSEKGRARLIASLKATFADAVKHVAGNQWTQLTEGMNLENVILAAAAPELEGKNRRQQGRVLDRLRREFGEDLVPKNVTQLRRQLKAPEVQDWVAYFDSLKSAATDTLPEITTTTTTEVDATKTKIGELAPAIEGQVVPIGTAANNVLTAITTPIGAIPGAIQTSVTQVSLLMAEMARLVAEAERLRKQAEPYAGSSGSYESFEGGGSASGGGGGGSRRRRRRSAGRAIAPQLPSGSGAQSGGRTTTVSATQTINVDRMDVHSEADKQSILTSLRFLAPWGV